MDVGDDVMRLGRLAIAASRRVGRGSMRPKRGVAIAAKRGALLSVAIATALARTHPAIGGTVITDGSLGAARSLTGPNYSIVPSLGQIHGGNLFQSFQTFDLSAGDIATFSGPTTVKTVLARVTGGQSNIDGTLACSIPNASFYLVNPSGVVFGPSAALNVQGSFAVTTADEIKLSDGRVFAAPGASDATLTSASPAAFGFLAKQPAALTVNGALLGVPTGKGITLAAGAIQISGSAIVRAPRGLIGVLSVAAPNVATLSAGHAPVAAPGTVMGNVTIQQNSALDTTSTGGGQIAVSANDLTLTDSAIDARTLGAINGAGINLQLTGTLLNSDSAIFTNTSGSGKAGDINVSAASIDAINGQSSTATGIDARSLAKATGAGGDISVRATDLSLADGQEITASTASGAHGGSIAAVADRISISGVSNNANGALSGFLDNTTGSGAGGNVRVHTHVLRIDAGGAILAGTLGTGILGNISVTADDLIIHGNEGENLTGITTTTASTSLADAGFLSVHAGNIHLLGQGGIVSFTSMTGTAGTVAIRASSLTLSDDGQVESDSTSTGSAGKVLLNVNRLRVDGTNSGGMTTISADSENGGGGPAGDVTVQADLLTLTNGATITANPLGAGPGGNISIFARTLQISGIGFGNAPARISSTAIEGSTGQAGSIQVTADSLGLANEGEISTDTNSTGIAGSVQIKAGALTLSSAAGISSDTFGPAHAGDVTVDATTAQISDGADIDTTSFGPGAAGKVSVAAKVIQIDGRHTVFFTGIESDSNDANSGNAGSVLVKADSLSLSAGGQITSDTDGVGKGGDVAVVAGQIKIDGRGNDNSARISADTDAPTGGAAGNVRVHGTSIRLIYGGKISSTSLGNGNGGTISVAANAVVVDGTDASSPTEIAALSEGGSGRAGDVSIHADRVLVNSSGLITTDTFASGAGGQLNLTVGSLTLDAAGSPFETGLAAGAEAGSTGVAGDINVNATAVTLIHDGSIVSDTSGQGSGGTVRLNADELTLDGTGGNGFTVISSNANEKSSGNAGAVDVDARHITFLNGGEIKTLTAGTGRGGDVNVVADRLTMDGRQGRFSTGIVASAVGTFSAAPGNIQVDAHDVHLIAGSIDSDNNGAGQGGEVTVRAGDFIANPQGAKIFTGISAKTTYRGAAGSVRATFDEAQLVDGAQITSSTNSSGNGGDVLLDARSLRVDAAASGRVTGVIADADAPATGRAGTIRAQLGNAAIVNGGEISSSTFASGDGGDVNVTADDLLLDGSNGKVVTGLEADAVDAATGTGGNVRVLAHGYLTLRGGGSIRALAVDGNAGNVEVTANQLNLRQGAITTSAFGAGGNIVIGPGSSLVIYPGGRIAAASISKLRSDNGGNVTIGRTALTFLPGVGIDAISARANQGNGGNIQIDSSIFLTPPGTPTLAIDSSSLGGIAGKITVESPNVDLAGELVPLVSALSAPGVLLAPSCGMQVSTDQSSFTVEGGNGLPADPEHYLPSGIGPTTPAAQR